MSLVWNICIAVSLVFVLLRVLRGPSSADRVIALDVIATIGVAYMAISFLDGNEIFYLDVAVIMALVSFVATIAAAIYIGRGGGR